MMDICQCQECIYKHPRKEYCRRMGAPLPKGRACSASIRKNSKPSGAMKDSPHDPSCVGAMSASASVPLKEQHMIQYREMVTRNTDPQKRCYDGYHFSSVKEWSEWKDICETKDKAGAEDSIATFKRINFDREYRTVPLQ
jgi:hypothetical protein